MTRMSCIAASVAVLALCSFSQLGFAGDLAGTVRLSGQPVSGAKVTLWRIAGKKAPALLAEASTDVSGAFKMLGFPEGGAGVYYLTTKSGPGNVVTLMSVLGEAVPPAAVINELTTVASVFTNARFINGTAISGNDVGSYRLPAAQARH